MLVCSVVYHKALKMKASNNLTKLRYDKENHLRVPLGSHTQEFDNNLFLTFDKIELDGDDVKSYHTEKADFTLILSHLK